MKLPCRFYTGRSRAATFQMKEYGMELKAREEVAGCRQNLPFLLVCLADSESQMNGWFAVVASKSRSSNRCPTMRSW